MKLSIITICYNIEDIIERTCKSILNQTNQDFEWIVIDGGSTDGTSRILEQYKSRIDIYVSEKDSGIYDAMNKGITRARGAYIIFMNGGDSFYHHEILENTLPLLREADIYYGSTNLLHSTGTSQVLHYPEFLPSDFFLDHNINHQSTFIKRRLFEEFGLYNTMLPITAETIKWVVYQKNHCSFRYLPHIIANYAAGGASDAMQNNTLDYIKRHYTRGEILFHFQFFKPLVHIRNFLMGIIQRIASK